MAKIEKVPLSLNVEKPLKDELNRIAKSEHRTMSAVISIYIENIIREKSQ